MEHEIWLASSEDEIASTRRVEAIAVSDTSEEEWTRRPVTTPSRPTPSFAPAAKAARKSAQGATQARRHRTLASKQRSSQPSQRAPTQRTIVKTEPDDWVSLAALQSQAALADTHEPRLTEIPFPLDVSVRLEEIRLALKHPPSCPVVKLDIAFRHVEQSTNTATPAAFTSFPLPVPPAPSPGSAVDVPDGAKPPPTLLRISRNPAIPLKAPNPFSASFVRPPAQQDLRDVLIRLRVLDVGASPPVVLYEGATSMAEDARLCFKGERTLRRSPDGSQVAVRWEVKLPEALEMRAPPSEAELREWIVREMKRCEAEWRREAAERLMASAELEAQPSLLYGPPPSLVLDPSAPPPSSLIPGLESSPTASYKEPLRFAPVPRYRHTSYASRSVPLYGTLLETFPQTKDWENSSVANPLVVEKTQDAFDPGVAEEDEGGGAGDGRKTAEEDKVEIEWRTKNLVDYGSFDAPDPGRTIRDFTVLKRLLRHLQVDLVELAKLEREATEQDNEESRVELEHFAFEHSLAQDHVLTRALAVFEELAGRTAYRVQQDHRLIDDEQIITKQEDVDVCWMCGAYLCSVHAALAAYNEPTKPPFDPTHHSRYGCAGCGAYDCLSNTQQPGDVHVSALEKALREEGMPALDPCTASLLLGRPVPEGIGTAPPPPEPSRKPSKNAQKWNTAVLQPIASDGYIPCGCAGDCMGDCTCAQARTYCDRWCGCSASCPRRFRGCRDHVCAESAACWCRDRLRQCDPQICACTAKSCTNSDIRLGRQKAIVTVRSQISGGGYGAILLEPVQKGDFIGLYGGEQFPSSLTDENSTNEAKWGHWKANFADTVEQSYWFDIDNGDAMDSSLLGNVIRFINRGGERANVGSRVVNIAGTHQIALIAEKVLKAGDELFLDYGPGFKEDFMESGDA